VSAQNSFDRDLRRAMSRRQFLASLVRASGAAVVLSSPLVGCGSLQGGLEDLRAGATAPPFNSVQRAVIAKIIDGFNPPDTELRTRLAAEDADYDPVAAFMTFAHASGAEFQADMAFLLNFLNILPSITRTFRSRYGLPAPPELRWFGTNDANRYFLFLRDSSLRALRNIFSGAKFVGTAPLYTNEKVGWKFMRYPGPWILDPAKPTADRELSTSFDMAQELEQNIATLRGRVVAHDDLREGLKAARVVGGSGRLVLETDVVVVGSGAGGSFVAAQLAEKTDQRVLILEKGDFIEPIEFLQRERIMMPRMLDTEFSVIEIFGYQVPTVSTAVAVGKLVGGSATINHALAFEPPRPVIRDWQEHEGAKFGYDDLAPHLDAIRTLLRIAPVPESQISGSNLALRRGAVKLGLPHHGPTVRNAHQCIGCGYCDLGCRYNRKLTPLNVVLPMAARRGAQVIANCRVDNLILETLPNDGRNGRTRRVVGLIAQLTDARGNAKEPVEIRAKRVVLAAGPFGSPRILLRSGVSSLRTFKGVEPAVGERFSTHATITFCSDFDEAIFPSAATPPMGYFVKKYEVEDQTLADPARHHVRYALEGLLNHPLAHAQVTPYESAESHQAFMKRFNQTMTLAVMFRDRPVGRVTSRGFEYELAEEDHGAWLDALRTGARIMFAAGGRRVFFNTHRPLIINSPDEVDTVLSPAVVAEQRIQITSGHPMGGCALGEDARRAVVDSHGRSWDVEGLYVADSSILPTSLGVNPCYTVYALGRYIGSAMVEEIRAQR
jgi:choline dehydrogenase-like flavoprotein